MRRSIIFFFSSIVFLTGCLNQFKFRADDTDSQKTIAPPGNEVTRNPDTPDVSNPKPDDPIIVDPDTGNVLPVVYKRGECTKDPHQVVSCLNCQITQRPLAIPLSKKAAQLLQIMENGCAIKNKSDPKTYRAPSRATIMKYLNRANATMYPDSPMTTRQQQNVDKWVANDKKNLERLFGGLWYNPPYSDDFETYFGIEPREARYFFCFEQPDSTFSLESMTPLYSIEYYQCMHEYGFPTSQYCTERAAYVKGNIYRKQLQASIIRSLEDPINDQELVPANKCHWETMTGFYNLEMENKLIDWKNAGFEVVVSFESGQPRCESVTTASIPLNAKVTVAGKLCEDF